MTLFIDPNPLAGFLRVGFDTKEKLSKWVMDNVGVPKARYFMDQGVTNYQLQTAIAKRDDKLANWYYNFKDEDIVKPLTSCGVIVCGGATNIRWHFIRDGSPGTPELISNWA
jgi:hypothetical protein